MKKNTSAINEKQLVKILKKADTVFYAKYGTCDVYLSEGHFIVRFDAPRGGAVDTFIYQTFGDVRGGWKVSSRGVEEARGFDFDGMLRRTDAHKPAHDTRLIADMNGRLARLYECNGDFAALNGDFVKILNADAVAYSDQRRGNSAKISPVLFDSPGVSFCVLPINYGDQKFTHYLASQTVSAVA